MTTTPSDYAASQATIQAFSDQHPWTSIRNPTQHTLQRDGDTLSCLDCGTSIHAPCLPPPPPDPMTGSLSRFD